MSEVNDLSATQKPMTLWYRLHTQWELNHVEDGHVFTDEPTGKFPSQKSNWSGARWRREHKYLNDENVVVDNWNMGEILP